MAARREAVPLNRKAPVLKFRRKRADEELRARARQQAAVAELGQRALAGTDLSALMEDAVALVAQVLEVEYCKVLKLLTDNSAMVLRAGTGWKDDYVGNTVVSAGADSQDGFTLLSRAPVIVEDLREETRFSGPALLHDHGVVSGLSVIIHGRERPFGVLGAHSTRRLKFTSDDIHFLQAIANVLAAAIDRKRTEEALQKANEQLTGWVSELQRHNRESALLNEMGDLLQTCLSEQEAYRVITQFGGKLFPDESGALFMLNSSRNLVEAASVWGPDLAGERVFAPELCWALRRGRPHLSLDSPASLVCQHIGPEAKKATLCVPMMAQGETLGMLHVQDGPRDVPESEQRLAATLAEHVGMAVANLRLRERLRIQSIRDSLTGLFNRRYLEESLDRELRRAARRNRPLGIMMIDLDHFKRFNDEHGHEAGDALLREMGAFLTKRTRDEDIACRYGGEEFIVILPEASLEVTCQRAELLRQEVKSLRVLVRERTLEGVTLSLGVVVSPDHGTTAAEVLRAADQALYRAKAEGRDRAACGGEELQSSKNKATSSS